MTIPSPPRPRTTRRRLLIAGLLLSGGLFGYSLAPWKQPGWRFSSFVPLQDRFFALPAASEMWVSTSGGTTGRVKLAPDLAAAGWLVEDWPARENGNILFLGMKRDFLWVVIHDGTTTDGTRLRTIDLAGLRYTLLGADGEILDEAGLAGLPAEGTILSLRLNPTATAVRIVVPGPPDTGDWRILIHR